MNLQVLYLAWVLGLGGIRLLTNISIVPKRMSFYGNLFRNVEICN